MILFFCRNSLDFRVKFTRDLNIHERIHREGTQRALVV